MSLKMTARELLVAALGDVHDLHTIVAASKPTRNVILFVCSCGAWREVEATAANTSALRNVVATDAFARSLK